MVFFRNGSPNRKLTTDDVKTLGSFTPPRGRKKVTVFHHKIPLIDPIDKDEKDNLEIRIVLKADKRGLNQPCDTSLCGVATKLIKVPIKSPGNDISENDTGDIKI